MVSSETIGQVIKRRNLVVRFGLYLSQNSEVFLDVWRLFDQVSCQYYCFIVISVYSQEYHSLELLTISFNTLKLEGNVNNNTFHFNFRLKHLIV